MNTRNVCFVLFLLCFFCLVLNSIAQKQTFLSYYPKKGLASWYALAQTATNELYDGETLTCAMRRKDYGKFYRVCNSKNGNCVVVRHNDWGPRRSLYNKGRIIDLSKAAFSELGNLDEGLLPVTIEAVAYTAIP